MLGLGERVLELAHSTNTLYSRMQTQILLEGFDIFQFLESEFVKTLGVEPNKKN
jgi:hypothetical protein